MKQVTITVRGRVQGVFYRHSARIKAADLGITGWIRNEPDGSVSILAEGEPATLEEFVSWCREGPPLAAVEAVEFAWAEATGGWRDFEMQ